MINERKMRVKKVAPVSTEEYQKIMQEYENGNSTGVSGMGERIVAGLFRVNGMLAAYCTQDRKNQWNEIDIRWDWREDGKDYTTAYEVKTDCGAFCKKGRKYKNKALKYYEAYTGRVSDAYRGTGNVFIEILQRAPRCLLSKIKSGKPLTAEEIRMANEWLHQEPDMEGNYANGWYQIIRDNPIRTTPGRHGRSIWFVLPVPYTEGRRILIVSITDENLIKLVERKKMKGELRHAHSCEYDKKGRLKYSWGYLLPLSDLFEFAVKDPGQTDPYVRSDFSFDMGHVERFGWQQVIGLGALSANGSGAIAYLWDVDQGDAGYTTYEKAAGFSAESWRKTYSMLHRIISWRSLFLPSCR